MKQADWQPHLVNHDQQDNRCRQVSKTETVCVVEYSKKGQLKDEEEDDKVEDKEQAGRS